jgi:hypothetical protein
VSNAQDSLERIGDISEGQSEKALDWANERQEWDQDQWLKNREGMSGIQDSQLENAAKYQQSEADYLEKVEGWDTEERRASESASAQSEVAAQAEAGRENALRRLESYGVDPSQTRNSALDSGIRMEEAKMKAGAANTARSDVEKTGMAMKEGLLGMGQAQAGAAAGGGGNNSNYGAGTGDMWGESNQAIGNWGDAASGAGSIAAADQGNKNSMFGDILGAGAGLAGAAIPFMAEGGEVEGPGGPKDDAIDAKLSDGEFVIPEEVVRRKGTEFFDKLIEKVKTENAEREKNAQITAEAMATPPPEAIAPEGMPNQPPGMAQGGEIQRRPLLFNKGGEVVGYADGGAAPMGYAQGGEVNYPPPPTARMGAR